MNFEKPYQQPPQETVTPEPAAVEETKAKEGEPESLERIENESDIEYRKRMLDVSEEIEERLAAGSGEFTEEEIELYEKDNEAISRAKEVNETILEQRRVKVVIEGKRKIPQALYDRLINLSASMSGDSVEEAERRVGEFSEPISEIVKKYTEREGMNLDLANTDRETLESVAENSENLNDILQRAIEALKKVNPALAEQLEKERLGVFI